MIKTGQILNDTYEIRERLGSGGGGIIYKAFHRRMRKLVAIKLIKDEIKGELQNRAEVDVLKNLKHEFLPQVLDFFEDGNDVYTVMEFIEGQNFKQLIQSGRKFSETQVRKYALQLCEAVEYLHHHVPPIIHSDIKPANIMLTPQDNICLIDFNISMVADNGFADAKGGSKDFGAPEQFRRLINAPAEIDEFHEETRFISDDDDTEILIDEDKSSSSIKTKNVGRAYIDVRTDVYGIGASIYYMLTSRTPADGTLDFRGIHCSSAIKDIIVKAMNPIPSKRFKNITELSKALKSQVGFKFVSIAAVCAATVGVLVASILIIVNSISNKADTLLPTVSESETNSAIIQTEQDSTSYSIDETVELSDEMEVVNVPNIVGLNKDEAIKVLQSLNLSIELTYAESSTVEKDCIISQSVPAEMSVSVGEKVILTISDGYNWNIERFYNEMLNVINEERSSLGYDPLQLNSNLSDGCKKEVLDGTYSVVTYNELWYNNYDVAQGYYETEFDFSTYTTERESAVALLKFEESNFSARWKEKEFTDFGVFTKENSNGTFFIYWVTAYKNAEVRGTWKETGVNKSLYIKTACYSRNKAIVGAESVNKYEVGEKINVIATTDTGYYKLSDGTFIHADYLTDKEPSPAETNPSYITIRGKKYSTDVKELDLQNMNLNDNEIKDLIYMTNLEILWLNNNNISNLEPLRGLTKLNELHLGHNRISDLSPLKDMNKLKILGIKHNSLSSLSGIENLTELSQLSFNGNKIKDISALSNLTALERLWIYNNQITDLSPLRNCTKIIQLDIGNNPISDISPLSGMSNMRYLYMYGTNIKNLNAIKGLSSITHLDISGTNVDEVAFIKNYERLKKLGIYNIDANNKEIKDLKKQIPNCDIYDTKDYFDEMYGENYDN